MMERAFLTYRHQIPIFNTLKMSDEVPHKNLVSNLTMFKLSLNSCRLSIKKSFVSMASCCKVCNLDFSMKDAQMYSRIRVRLYVTYFHFCLMGAKIVFSTGCKLRSNRLVLQH